MPSASTKVGRGSLVGGVTQTFIPKWSGSLVVLPGLGHCSFSLTLITEHGDTNCSPMGTPASEPGA